MKKTSLILLAALFCCCRVFAKEYPITFTPDTMLKQHSAFNRVILLDLRHQKQYIGSLSAGINKKPIVTTYPLDSMMSRFGAVLTGKAAVKGNNNLVIVLKDLIVEEKTNGEFTIGNIYLNAGFYFEQNGRYTTIHQIDSLFEFRIADHDAVQYLAKVSNRIFSGLLCSIATVTVPEGQPSFSLQEVQEMDQRNKSRYPVYSQAPKPGIYYTFEQFLGNAPGETDFIHKHNVGGDVVSDRFYLKQEGRKKGPDLSDTVCYAVYSQGKWYVPAEKGKDFREMIFKNGDFFYTRKSEGLVLYSAGSFGYFGGGIVGYLVADAVAEGLNEDHPNRRGKAVFRYKLDPATGEGIKVERLE